LTELVALSSRAVKAALYHGFNFMSLNSKDVPQFTQTIFMGSIEAAKLLRAQFKKDTGSMSDEEFQKWRVTQYENWAEYTGFKLPGVQYP
jgi:hypothetical protein